MKTWRVRILWGIAAAAAMTLAITLRAEFLGSSTATSFDLCEATTDGSGRARPECQGADIRFQGDATSAADLGSTDFGFALATGFLNGDDYVDLVVGDPKRNRVYVFFGRLDAPGKYALSPADLADRMVAADTGADVILTREDPYPGQVGAFGFSVAVGPERSDVTCAPGNKSAPLVIGAPGAPGTTGNAPGTVFYIPAGRLCLPASGSPTPTTLDPESLGQAFQSPWGAVDDEFGYSVALGRLLTGSSSGLDVAAGARGARAGAGEVAIFPVEANAVVLDPARLAKIEGQDRNGFGEVLAVGDLDRDFNTTTNPHGNLDDFAVGAVGHAKGKVVTVQGPVSPTDGRDADGVLREGSDPQIRSVVGEKAGDFFGFSVAVSAQGDLAVGAVGADNVAPTTQSSGGGDPLTNVSSGSRNNAGKVYVWRANVIDALGTDTAANTADVTLVARRSGDQLGIAVAYADLDGSGTDDLAVAARREDGSGLKVDEINQGTVYVVYDSTTLQSPVDLNKCATNSNCAGVSSVDVMLFGGDRAMNLGDEIGFALAAGNFNGDTSKDLFISSLTHKRVYAVTLEDTDGDRATKGRNIRDDDDDNDETPDATDCGPLSATIKPGATETICNNIDENCNGMADDALDADGDGFDVCAASAAGDRDDKAADCADNDAKSFPGATELCDGNDNACRGSVPGNETDVDGDFYVDCTGWVDTQADQPTILGGGDCDRRDGAVFPGAAPKEAAATACMRDRDGDDYGDKSPPSGVTAGTDCDDISASSAFTFPGAAPLEANPGACMKDVDGDDYGDAAAPSGVVRGTDCADTDTASHPGATEVCDGNNNACGGSIPPEERDPDGDKYVQCAPWADTQLDNPTFLGGGDCDPADDKSFPGAAPNEAVPGACMRDVDGDDFGDLTPPAGVIPGTDCDDDPPNGAVTFPGAAQIEAPLNCMKDADNDGYGDATASLPVVKGRDCNDAVAATHPTAAETADDGIDQDCSGADTVTCYVDGDLDGYGTTPPLLATDGDCTDAGESPFNTDCNDADRTRNPGAQDLPGDGIDQDCNGADAIVCFLDADRDGSGTVAGTTTVALDGHCDAAQQEATGAGDCADADPNTHPGATEECDGNDNRCLGSVPATEIDGDGDHFAACAGWADTQGDQPGVTGGGDCDDTDRYTFPGSSPKEVFAGACMRDRDGDDYGDLAAPAGITRGSDCDDSSLTAAATFPGAAQVEAPLNCMKDVDDDGYGDAAVALPVAAGGDCDDRDATSRPGGTEVCDGNDNGCAGSVPAGEIDGDGDGYVACAGWSDVQGDNPAIRASGECDGADADTFPGAAPREAVTTACMRDKDGDDFGDLTPPAGVTPGTDCDDRSPAAAATFPGAAQIEAPLNCMKDTDNDGYGDPGVALPVVRGADCDDNDATRHPGAPEIPADGIDQDCNGSDLAACHADADGDGFGSLATLPAGDGDCTDPGESSFSTDCNDANPAIHPGATDVPADGIDQDCSGTDTILCFMDADQDGHGGAPGTTVPAPDGVCNKDQNESTIEDDCNDANPNVFPGAAEITDDGVDQDCSGTDAVTCFADADRDGYGGPTTLVATDGDCTDPGEATTSLDCNDANPNVFPGAPEIPADGIDQDCNGSDMLTCFVDADGDTYGGSTTIPPTDADCTDPGESPFGNDCNDGNASIHPGATETPDDGVDQDCNGADTKTCIVDADRDAFGTVLGTTTLAADGVCNTAQGESTTATDCADGDATIFPGAPETPDDGIDQNCNGQDTVTCFVDGDGDTFGRTATLLAPDGDCTDAGESTVNTDCNDANPTVHPGATEIPGDGIDQDCNGHDTVTCFVDGDGDGFGSTTTLLAPDGDCTDAGEATVSTDCNDAEPAVHPGATEIPGDGIDQDCSGADTVTCFVDGDGDTYGSTTTLLAIDGDCTDPGESAVSTDCNDADAAIHPGATEFPNDGIDQNCDGSDLVACFADTDLDGFGSTTTLPPGDADCTDPGESSFSTDCNDANATVFPGAPETPGDGIDQDCNGHDTITCIVDADKDGFGTSLGTTTLAADGTCDTAQQEATSSDDCNDADATIHPGATEIPGDGIDQDCSGGDLVTCFVDGDLDGFGGTGTVQPPDGDCIDPGEATTSTDCNDADATIHPGATEIPGDGIDQDCSGTDTVICVADLDKDGHGTVAGTLVTAPDGSCDTAQGESSTADDCNDADPNTRPGATERCDGNDNLCAGALPVGETDPDGDGFVACAGWEDTQGDNPAVLGGGDCDPADADTFPGAASKEIFASACMRDRDGDNYGDLAAPAGITRGSDCDDTPVTGINTFPGAAHIEAPLNCMRDNDDDGWGDATAALPIVAGTDCDDANPARHPGAADQCGDGVDSDCDGSDPVCGPSAPQDLTLKWVDHQTLSWAPVTPRSRYTVIRGELAAPSSLARAGRAPSGPRRTSRYFVVIGDTFRDPDQPRPGRVIFYQVTDSLGKDAAVKRTYQPSRGKRGADGTR